MNVNHPRMDPTKGDKTDLTKVDSKKKLPKFSKVDSHAGKDLILRKAVDTGKKGAS